MLDTARQAMDLLRGLSREEYDRNDSVRIALAHLVQVIGEAASRVSEPTRLAHPEVPWIQIIGMRHKIVHDYMNVDYDIVWEVVRFDLPALVETLRKATAE
jgi:uncharacterized protein with HEPN domain